MTMRYWDWIRQEAALIHADGCTGVTNMYADCCLQHDLEFYYGTSATEAYRVGWAKAMPITFAQANDHFKRCHFRMGRLGHWNPIAWVRYAAVRMRKGRSAWDTHRRRAD